MFKKLICVIFVLIAIFTLPLSAIKAGDDFYVYGTDTKTVADILNLSKQELEGYCEENSITYLAVNKDNTKQIRLTETQTDFSATVGNLSHLSDDTILTLARESLIPESVVGQVVNRDSQKFIKMEAKTSDSGGDFILTEYITVADKKLYTLSFYTDINTDTDYINEIFISFNEEGFYTQAEESVSRRPYEYIIPAAIVVFIAVIIVIIITIVRDIKRKPE